MPKRDLFHFFDPTQEFSVWYGRLPHWEQPGATYFITFHADDSLPRSRDRAVGAGASRLAPKARDRSGQSDVG